MLKLPPTSFPKKMIFKFITTPPPLPTPVNIEQVTAAYPIPTTNTKRRLFPTLNEIHTKLNVVAEPSHLYSY